MSSSNANKSVSRSILTLTAGEARAFFLKHESYCNIDLPQYFRFDDLLKRTAAVLEQYDLQNVRSETPRNHDAVNHAILNNKDGKYGWRPLELIHPALYVSLVNKMTAEEHWKTIIGRFGEFAGAKKIHCLSLPIEFMIDEKDRAVQVMYWWHEIEQKSLELALDFRYVFHADITDCYGMIYTHSIAWAIHGKAKAKGNRNDESLIGNIIDAHIQDMRQGQTNGIPQGSVLMDFIAEMVLGYADLELAKRIRDKKIKEYHVLRYRDDYRIFVNNPQDGEKILKCLTEVMIDLGLKLNAAKTRLGNLVIRESIKADKLAWMTSRQEDENLQKHLLIIYSHSLEFPNSGSVVVALVDYYKRLLSWKRIQHPLPLISITVDIAYRDPRSYPICSAILSKLLSVLPNKLDKRRIITKILRRFSQLPNTGHMEMWLQRTSLTFAPDMPFKEALCCLVKGDNVPVWNNDWISSRKLKLALDAKRIFDLGVAQKLDPIVPTREVELFMARGGYYK